MIPLFNVTSCQIKSKVNKTWLYLFEFTYRIHFTYPVSSICNIKISPMFIDYENIFLSLPSLGVKIEIWVTLQKNEINIFLEKQDCYTGFKWHTGQLNGDLGTEFGVPFSFGSRPLALKSSLKKHQMLIFLIKKWKLQNSK